MKTIMIDDSPNISGRNNLVFSKIESIVIDAHLRYISAHGYAVVMRGIIGYQIKIKTANSNNVQNRP